jgi:NAD(P)H dehydrogenase (quinone)
MKHVVVIAHPRIQSFTHAMARTYATQLETLGHDVVVRDLYRRHFDPVLGEGELLGAARRSIPGVVRREQRHLLEAGAVAFFYPLWWALMPAMLKGYFDRVLSRGFAYDLKDDDMAPRLTGKKALIFTSSGADMKYLRKSKQWQSMRTIEEDHILSLCGIELLEHVHFASITGEISDRVFAQHADRVKRAVHENWGAAPAAPD